LKQKKWLKATLIFFIGVLWVGSYDSVFGFVNGLGVDSFAESRSFDIEEAKFFLSTLIPIFRFNYSIQIIGFYTLSAFTFCVILNYILANIRIVAKYYSYFTFSIASILIVGSMYLSVSKTVSLFLRNSESYQQIVKNFSNKAPIINIDQTEVDIYVYIGESTSVMNMGVYGYPRKTTPRLTKLKKINNNFMLFQNVFSTHTHTSQSLLEALSFGLIMDDQHLPIDKRKRVSIVDILNEGKITVDLYSNQGQTGTWNQASSIIFKNANRQFSFEEKNLGNSEVNYSERPSDHKFFSAKIVDKRIKMPISKKSLTFLHSYAGHGPYLLNNMPDIFHERVDQKLIKKDAKAIFGKTFNNLTLVESYDSSIKYIDFATTEIIKKLDSLSYPSIFIYFSDHGESVYTGRAHDSSRFIHEMVRIPFIIYFNEKAKRSRPDLFNKYKQLANDSEVATLAQLPSTIFDLLGVQLFDKKEAIELPIIGEKTFLPPIVVCETVEGINYVNLNLKKTAYKFNNGEKLVDKTDEVTKNFVVTRNNVSKNTSICYHRSNSLAKAIRGKLVSDCLEVDIMVDETDNIAIYHPPAKDSGLMLSDILELSHEGKQVDLWLDSKNLQTKRTCSALLNTLNKTYFSEKKLLIEFPSKSYLSKKEINECVDKLRKKGFFTSYYVPTTDAINCSKKLMGGIEFEKELSCIALQKDLLAAIDSQLYTDFSFDYLGILAMEAINFTKELKWNTWNVTSEKYTSIQPERFRMVILVNGDPNNI